MSQAPIFVSYSRHDATFALQLGRDLRAAGVNLWIDQLDIPPGGRWDREVERALKASRMLLVVLSPEGVASENVMDEVGYALGESKRVVPVMSRACDLPLRLQRVQYVDLSRDYAAGLERLTTTLIATEAPADTGARRAEPLRAVPPAAAERRAAGWKPLAGAATLAALVLGAGLLWKALAPRPVVAPPGRDSTREAPLGTAGPPPGLVQGEQPADAQWLVVVGSFQKGNGADGVAAATGRARALASRLPGEMRPLVLETPSDDYPNLAPGLVVVALGPYPSMEAADRVRSTVERVVPGPYIKQGRFPRP